MVGCHIVENFIIAHRSHIAEIQSSHIGKNILPCHIAKTEMEIGGRGFYPWQDPGPGGVEAIVFQTLFVNFENCTL